MWGPGTESREGVLYHDLCEHSCIQWLFWFITSQVDVDFKAIRDQIITGQYRPDLNDNSLFERDRISAVWPQGPPKDSLHVFVIICSPTLNGGECLLIFTAPRSNQSQDAHVGTKRKSNERSVDGVQPLREFKRMSNPLYLVECC
jgi:hypothetical protein